MAIAATEELRLPVQIEDHGREVVFFTFGVRSGRRVELGRALVPRREIGPFASRSSSRANRRR